MGYRTSSPSGKRRVSGFLLGLILGLALFLCGLEWTSRPSADKDDSTTIDDIDQDLEMLSPVEHNDMISAVQAPTPQGMSENVHAVDHATASTDKISPTTSTLVIGNGDGVAKKSNVTEALPQTPVDNDSTVLTVVEQLPEFPGGIVEFMKWLTRSLRYPNQAQSLKLQGKVVVSFIVNKDGSIASPKIEKSDDPILSNEVLRVIKTMPRWKPGLMNKKPCRTMVAIPVNFAL